jgi:hypothetical protein
LGSINPRRSILATKLFASVDKWLKDRRANTLNDKSELALARNEIENLNSKYNTFRKGSASLFSLRWTLLVSNKYVDFIALKSAHDSLLVVQKENFDLKLQVWR